MNRQRSLSGLTLAILFVLIIGACGETPTPEPTNTPVPPTAVPPTPVPPTAVPATAVPATVLPATAAPILSPALPLGEETYSSAEAGFSIGYPEGWQAIGFGPIAFIAESEEAMSGDTPTSPFILISVDSLENVYDVDASSATNAEEMLAVVTEDFESDTSVEVGEVEGLRVGGEDAAAVDIWGEDEGIQLAGRIVAVYMDDRGAVIIGIAPAEAWQDFRGTFDAILDSVTFFAPTMPTAMPEPTTPPEPAMQTVRQWASSATASSEYGSSDWTAEQATGEPDTPECGDYETAWASASSDEVEWIELRYATPVVPTEVRIIQTYNPSQVSLVELVDTDGFYHEIYTADPAEMDTCPYTLEIPVEADYWVSGVRITIDQSVLGLSWNEIDAVELIGQTDEQVSAGGPPPEGFIWRVGGEGSFDEGQFGSPEGMDIGPDGYLYVADFFHGVYVVSPDDGSIVDLIGSDELSSPEDVEFGPDGNLYVTDWGNNAVFVYSPDGTLQRQWGEEGMGDGQFGTFGPDYVAVCSDGLVYVSDPNEDENEESYERIQVFDAEGNYLDQWNLNEIDEYFSVAGMDCGPDGNLYLAGFLGSYIMVLDPAGNVVAQLGEEDLGYTSLASLALDQDGYMYFSTWEGWIGQMDPDGSLVAQWGVEGDGEGTMAEGEFYLAQGIAVDSEGNVYVSDSTDSYVYITKFTFSGGGGSSITPPPVTEIPDGFIWRVGGESGFDMDQFGSAGGLTIGPDGFLYFADNLHGVLVIDTMNGGTIAFIGGDEMSQPSDVKVADDGTIFVTDWANNAVFAFAENGSFLYQWGEEGLDEGQFGSFSPEYLAVCNGYVYVQDSNTDASEEDYERVQVFDTEGNYVDQWNISEIDDYFSISGMDCGPDGNLYMAGFVGGYVMVLDPDGNHVGDLGTEALAYTGPHAIAVGEDGNVYVGTWDEGVMVFDAEGDLIGQWGTTSTEEGPRAEGVFYFPDGLAVDADGYIYVADWGDSYTYLSKFNLP